MVGRGGAGRGRAGGMESGQSAGEEALNSQIDNWLNFGK